MAMSPKERDEKRRAKAARLQEEDLRLKVRPGTKRALLELMEWAVIEEQGEAMTLMIHHIEALGHHALFRIARHEIEGHRDVRGLSRCGCQPGSEPVSTCGRSAAGLTPPTVR